MQHFPAAAASASSTSSSGGYVPYFRPPAPLPEAALLEDQQSPYPVSPMQSLSMSSPSWQWPDPSACSSSVSSATAQAQADEEETHYASQLRSSMAALLHGHIRQSSTASNASSTFSSYSDEFRSPVDSSTIVATLGIPSPSAVVANSARTNYAYNNHAPINETYAYVSRCYDNYNNNNNNAVVSPLMVAAANSSSSPPLPLPPVRNASSLIYVKYVPSHEKHPSWPMPNNSGVTIAPRHRPATTKPDTCCPRTTATDDNMSTRITRSPRRRNGTLVGTG